MTTTTRSLDDVAVLLSVDRSDVIALIRDGKLRIADDRQPIGRWRVELSEVGRYLSAHGWQSHGAATASERIAIHLTAISVGVATARSEIAADLPAVTERILDGDAEALAEGETIRDSFDSMIGALNGMARTADEWADVDSVAMAMVFGVLELFDAVDVANGWEDHTDPVVSARFKPARLAHRRRMCEKWLAETEGRDDAIAVEWRAECERNLELIAAGIEPE